MNGPIRLLTRVGVFCVSLAHASTLHAQIPNIPTPLRLDGKDWVVVNPPSPEGPEGSVSPQATPDDRIPELSRLFNDGNPKLLRAAAGGLLRDLSRSAGFFDLTKLPGCEGENLRSRFELSKDYVLLSWIGLDFAGKRTPYRILVHDGADPYVMVMPGLSGRNCSNRIFDVFVSPLKAARHASSYAYTAQVAPTDALVQPFLAAASGPLFASLSAIRGGATSKAFGTLSIEAREPDIFRKAQAQSQTGLLVQVGVLKPPLARATIKGKDLVRQPQPWTDFADAAASLADRLQFVDVRQSTCAVEFAGSMRDESLVVAADDFCVKDDAGRDSCRNKFDEAFKQRASEAASGCRTTADHQVRAANDTKPVADRISEGQIPAAVDEAMKAHLAALSVVETRFRELVANTKDYEELTADFSLTNAPLTRWGLGAMAAYAYDASTDAPRVKVGNDGKFALNPLSRQLSLVAVNLPVWGVDESKAFSLRGLIRPFVGVVTTPEFGLSAGVNLAVWHGLGVSIGAARLAVPTLGEKDSLLQVPADPNAPFARTTGRVRFWGISYNFPLK